MQNNSYKVLLVDDHPPVRSGIISALKELSEFDRIDAAGSIEEGRRYVSITEYDLILCDLSLPDGQGLDFLKNIRKNHSSVKLAVLTMHRDWQYLEDARRLEINGYLLKDTSTESIAAAVIQILNGKNIFPDNALPQSESNQSDLIANYETLTDREKDVLGLLLEGLLNKEIAEKLNLSIRTVEAHRANLMKKLNIKNTIALAVYKNIIR